MWKKSIFLLIGIVAVVVVFNQDRIQRLYEVLHLFDEDRIVHNFSNMRELMPAQIVPNEGAAQPWPVALDPLPTTQLRWPGDVSMEEFLIDTETTSLLVLRDGVIVHEEYRLGTQQQDLRISWSMAKSFLSAAFGVAVHEGKIHSIDDPVDRYVSTLAHTAYAGVPIVDVLNMASGVAFNEDYIDFNSDINRMGRVLALGASMDEFAHSLNQRQFPSGSNWHYVSIDTHVLAMVLRHATGTDLRVYLGQRIWRHLGAEGPVYYLTDGDGVDFALGGLNMQTRDYARFGELFRNNGRWGEQEIVPQNWVAVSTKANAPAVRDGSHVTVGYGYQWWVPDEAEYPGEFYAGGIYGQYIYVNPQARIVIVKTSAHRDFRNDGNEGNAIRISSLALFRAISDYYVSR